MDKLFKKIMTVWIGIWMLSATMMSVLALDYTLADYPEPFVIEGIPNFVIVVGEDAAASDTIGQALLLNDLQVKAVTPLEGLRIISGVGEESAIGDSLNVEWGTNLDDSDIPGLLDKEIRWGEDYDIHEELVLGNGLKVMSSLTSDRDYKENVFIEVEKKSIQYFYEFDDDIDLKDVDMDDPLEINFLGRTFKIVDVKDNDTLSAYVGNEFRLGIGESVEEDSKIVSVKNIGKDSVIVDVDGHSEIVKNSETEEINGISITVTGIFYDDYMEYRLVELIVGQKSRETYDDGDPYIGQDKDEPEWKWVLGELKGKRPVLGVSYSITRNDKSDNPIGIGECYILPNKYVSICLEGLTGETYEDYEIYFDTVEDENDNNMDALVFETNLDDGFSIAGTRSDEVYAKNGVLYYVRNGDTYKTSVLSFQIKHDDTVMDVDYNKTNFTIKDSLNKKLLVEFNEAGKDITKIKYENIDLSDEEDSVRTHYGYLIEDAENGVDRNNLVLNIPDEQVKAIVKISTDTKEVVEEGIPSEGVIINPIPSSAVALAEEISSPTSENLIIVGGPAINPLAKSVFGLSVADFTPNEAMIKLAENGDKVAMGVFGYSAVDTRNAAIAVYSGELEGRNIQEIKVISPSQKIGVFSVEEGNGITETNEEE